jgi:hypothetical protein
MTHTYLVQYSLISHHQRPAFYFVRAHSFIYWQMPTSTTTRVSNSATFIKILVLPLSPLSDLCALSVLLFSQIPNSEFRIPKSLPPFPTRVCALRSSARFTETERSRVTPSPLRTLRMITPHLYHRLKIKHQTLKIQNHSWPPPPA